MSVNDGGIVIVAAADVALSSFVIVDQPTTHRRDSLRSCCCQLLRCSRRQCVPSWFDVGTTAILRQTSRRPGSFCHSKETNYVVSDFNVRLDCPEDPHADQFRLMADCYGLKLHATGPTHQLGGMLHAVITHNTQDYWLPRLCAS